LISGGVGRVDQAAAPGGKLAVLMDAARKLLVIAYGVMKSQRPFQPA
jgi:hypothetical protein